MTLKKCLVVLSASLMLFGLGSSLKSMNGIHNTVSASSVSNEVPQILRHDFVGKHGKYFKANSTEIHTKYSTLNLKGNKTKVVKKVNNMFYMKFYRPDGLHYYIAVKVYNANKIKVLAYDPEDIDWVDFGIMHLVK